MRKLDSYKQQVPELPGPMRIERLRFDARDRWTPVSEQEVATELAAQFADLATIHQLLSAGHELQTAHAQYRKVR